MNTLAITAAAHATLAGTLPFPEIVARLIEAGVEYYHVDYVLLGSRVRKPLVEVSPSGSTNDQHTEWSPQRRDRDRLAFGHSFRYSELPYIALKALES
jgi:hypothetical protein